MIKATVITEKDSVHTDSYIEGTGTNILSELAALNGAIIRQLVNKPPYSFQKADNVLEILRVLTKYGLDNYEEESENV